MSDLGLSFTEEDTRWWTGKGSLTHEAVFSLVDRISSDQAGRKSKLREWQNLYEDRGSFLSSDGESGRRRVTYNIVKSCCDTAGAKIAKNRPRPMFVTSDGDFDEQERAKKLTKFCDGVFAEMDAYDQGQLSFRDATMKDGGALKVFAVGEKIRCERVMPGEILIDETDGYYGKPRQLHQRRRMHREVLVDMFPAKKGLILFTPRAKAEDARMPTAMAQSMVWVVESWALETSDGKGDGRHTICLENATLLDEPYTKATFPFVFYFWSPADEGFWSPGLAEELQGIQKEINRLLADIRLAQRRLGRPYIAIERGSDINKAKLTNEIGQIIEYSGQPPVFGQSPTMAPEVYQHLRELYERAYEITGISQMSARAEKPVGLDSGRALREFSDIESERFVLAGQRWEKFWMTVARKVVELARDLYEDGVDLTVKANSGAFIESIKWSDVDLEDDQFDLRCFPVSILPTTPAGRYDMVTDLAANALITPDQARDLLQFPDVEDTMTLESSAKDAIRKIIDSMLKGGQLKAPEPFYPLDLARSLAVQAYLRAEVKNCDEPALAKLRSFIAMVEDLQKLANPPPPPPPPMPMPGAPPQMGPDGTLQAFPGPPMPQVPLEGVNPAMAPAPAPMLG